MRRKLLSLGGFRAESISTRFVTFVIIGEICFGMLLGVTVTLYALRANSQQRKESIGQIGSAVAAALMPVIANQDSMHVEAQLRSIMHVTDLEAGKITCIKVVDGSGALIGQSDPGEECCTEDVSPTLVTLFTGPSVVSRPVTIDGLEVARVYIEFAPVGLWEALASPTLGGTIVVLAIALVSAPWTAWLVMRFVIEPLGKITDGAAELARGRRDLTLFDGRKDEIGVLAKTLDELSGQLREKEERLLASYREASEAYEAEADAKQEIEELMKVKSQFVAVASHELRGPLAVMRLYLEMLEDGEFGRIASRPAQAIASISSASSRLSSIVSDLMDAALLERGLMPLEFEEIQLEPIVQEAVADAAMLGEYRSGTDVQLHDDIGESTWVWGDAVRLRQVLDNLLSNAVKYSDGASLIKVRLTRDSEAVHVDVIDWGRGVPTERRQLLFSLFGRLDAADNRDTAGLGLGLAISARIAAAHKGTIRFRDNEDGRGAIFTLTLPLPLAGAEKEDSVVITLSGNEGVDDAGERKRA